MKRFLYPLIFICVISALSASVSSNELDGQLNKTKEELEQAQNQKGSTETRLQELESLKKKYEGSLNSMNYNYQLTREQLQITETSIKEKEEEIAQVETDINATEDLINLRYNSIKHMIRNMYMSQTPGWLSDIFATQTLTDLTKNLFYKKAVVQSIENDVQTLTSELQTIQEIYTILGELKVELAQEKEFLNIQQINLQNQINQTQKGISAAQSEMQNLNQALIGINQKINELTQKQREILAAKAAAALASTSVGDIVSNSVAISKGPPKDGGVYFSFWTYGYPHRVGMNQYGAFGRAKAGQSAEQILRAYYTEPSLVFNEISPKQIHILGCSWGKHPYNGGPNKNKCEEKDQYGNPKGTYFDLYLEVDEYLKGLGEMPTSWGGVGGMEALKAQAIAGRTYAWSYTNAGTYPICPSTYCQVYLGYNKGSYWEEAVLETDHQIITHQGAPILALYHSTAGGYTLNSEESGHFTQSLPYARGIADFDVQGNAYDGPEHGDSPWYFKAWGDEPWLSVAQVTDLANAALMPTSYNNQLALELKGGFSPEEIVETLNENGITPVKGLTAIEVIGANTAQVSILRVYYGQGEMVEISGERFKFIYNLRSPGTNAIWTTRFDVRTAAEL